MAALDAGGFRKGLAMRRGFLAVLTAFGIWAAANAVAAHDWATGQATAADEAAVTPGEVTATLYKSPYCGCCSGYAEQLRQSGFKVEVNEVDNLTPIRRMLGIGKELQSCHTAVIEGYVVEGHVPIADLRHLLAERPDIKGIALPGMPQGVPGMPGPKPDELMLYTIEKEPKAFRAQ